jgi:hypothetical protein
MEVKRYLIGCRVFHKELTEGENFPHVLQLGLLKRQQQLHALLIRILVQMYLQRNNLPRFLIDPKLRQPTEHKLRKPLGPPAHLIRTQQMLIVLRVHNPTKCSNQPLVKRRLEFDHLRRG